MALQKSFGAVGACVTRDLGKILFPNAKRDSLWRLNTISLIDAKSSEFDHYKYVKNEKEALFIAQNLKKTYDLVEFFGKHKYVIVDFFRDIYDVIYLSDGSIITKELRLTMNNLLPLLNVKDVIGAYAKSYPDIWFDAAKKLASTINNSDCIVIICPIYCVSGIRYEEKFDNTKNWDAFYVRVCNIILNRMQSVFYHLVGKSFILPQVPQFAECDVDHEYGPGIMHYRKQYFHAMIREFSVNIAGGFYEYKPTGARADAAINKLMDTWRWEASIGYGTAAHKLDGLHELQAIQPEETYDLSVGYP
ncbi:DUF6270 domain-containing protein [Bosea thiooxidans]